MKRHILIIATALLAIGCSKADMAAYMGEIIYNDAISGNGTIRIDNRELFQYFLDSLDTNKDGRVAFSEIEKVTCIDCHGRNMHSLDGIEILPALDSVICYDNSIRSLDLSSLPNLKYLDCSNNLLEELNVSATAIKELYAYPMNDASGKNMLNFLYVLRGQEIEYITSNRKSASPKRIPDETVIIAIPTIKGEYDPALCIILE